METSVRSTSKSKLRKNNHKNLRIVEAVYLRNFEVLILFSNDRMKIVDFAAPLIKYAKGDYAKYAEKRNFKKFYIEDGNIIWGKNWDLIFPVADIYEGRL